MREYNTALARIKLRFCSRWGRLAHFAVRGGSSTHVHDLRELVPHAAAFVRRLNSAYSLCSRRCSELSSDLAGPSAHDVELFLQWTLPQQRLLRKLDEGVLPRLATLCLTDRPALLAELQRAASQLISPDLGRSLVAPLTSTQQVEAAVEQLRVKMGLGISFYDESGHALLSHILRKFPLQFERQTVNLNLQIPPTSAELAHSEAAMHHDSAIAAVPALSRRDEFYVAPASWVPFIRFPRTATRASAEQNTALRDHTETGIDMLLQNEFDFLDETDAELVEARLSRLSDTHAERVRVHRTAHARVARVANRPVEPPHASHVDVAPFKLKAMYSLRHLRTRHLKSVILSHLNFMRSVQRKLVIDDYGFAQEDAFQFDKDNLDRSLSANGTSSMRLGYSTETGYNSSVEKTLARAQAAAGVASRSSPGSSPRSSAKGSMLLSPRSRRVSTLSTAAAAASLGTSTMTAEELESTAASLEARESAVSGANTVPTQFTAHRLPQDYQADESVFMAFAGVELRDDLYSIEPAFAELDSQGEALPGFDADAVLIRCDDACGRRVLYDAALDDLSAVQAFLLRLGTWYMREVDGELDRGCVVLRLLEAESSFQTAKSALLATLLEAYEHALSDHDRERLAVRLMRVIDLRPELGLAASTRGAILRIWDSYAAHTASIRAEAELLQATLTHQVRCEKDHLDETRSRVAASTKRQSVKPRESLSLFLASGEGMSMSAAAAAIGASSASARLAHLTYPRDWLMLLPQKHRSPLLRSTLTSSHIMRSSAPNDMGLADFHPSVAPAVLSLLNGIDGGVQHVLSASQLGCALAQDGPDRQLARLAVLRRSASLLASPDMQFPSTRGTSTGDSLGREVSTLLSVLHSSKALHDPDVVLGGLVSTATTISDLPLSRHDNSDLPREYPPVEDALFAATTTFLQRRDTVHRLFQHLIKSRIWAAAYRQLAAEAHLPPQAAERTIFHPYCREAAQHAELALVETEQAMPSLFAHLEYFAQDLRQWEADFDTRHAPVFSSHPLGKVLTTGINFSSDSDSEYSEPDDTYAAPKPLDRDGLARAQRALRLVGHAFDGKLDSASLCAVYGEQCLADALPLPPGDISMALDSAVRLQATHSLLLEQVARYHHALITARVQPTVDSEDDLRDACVGIGSNLSILSEPIFAASSYPQLSHSITGTGASLPEVLSQLSAPLDNTQRRTFVEYFLDVSALKKQLMARATTYFRDTAAQPEPPSSSTAPAPLRQAPSRLRLSRSTHHLQQASTNESLSAHQNSAFYPLSTVTGGVDWLIAAALDSVTPLAFAVTAAENTLLSFFDLHERLGGNNGASPFALQSTLSFEANGASVPLQANLPPSSIWLGVDLPTRLFARSLAVPRSVELEAMAQVEAAGDSLRRLAFDVSTHDATEPLNSTLFAIPDPIALARLVAHTCYAKECSVKPISSVHPSAEAPTAPHPTTAVATTARLRQRLSVYSRAVRVRAHMLDIASVSDSLLRLAHWSPSGGEGWDVAAYAAVTDFSTAMTSIQLKAAAAWRNALVTNLLPPQQLSQLPANTDSSMLTDSSLSLDSLGQGSHASQADDEAAFAEPDVVVTPSWPCFTLRELDRLVSTKRELMLLQAELATLFHHESCLHRCGTSIEDHAHVANSLNKSGEAALLVSEDDDGSEASDHVKAIDAAVAARQDVAGAYVRHFTERDTAPSRTTLAHAQLWWRYTESCYDTPSHVSGDTMRALEHTRKVVAGFAEQCFMLEAAANRTESVILGGGALSPGSCQTISDHVLAHVRHALSLFHVVERGGVVNEASLHQHATSVGFYSPMFRRYDALSPMPSFVQSSRFAHLAGSLTEGLRAALLISPWARFFGPADYHSSRVHFYEKTLYHFNRLVNASFSFGNAVRSAAVASPPEASSGRDVLAFEDLANFAQSLWVPPLQSSKGERRGASLARQVEEADSESALLVSAGAPAKPLHAPGSTSGSSVLGTLLSCSSMQHRALLPFLNYVLSETVWECIEMVTRDYTRDLDRVLVGAGVRGGKSRNAEVKLYTNQIPAVGRFLARLFRHKRDLARIREAPSFPSAGQDKAGDNRVNYFVVGQDELLGALNRLGRSLVLWRDRLRDKSVEEVLHVLQRHVLSLHGLESMVLCLSQLSASLDAADRRQKRSGTIDVAYAAVLHERLLIDATRDAIAMARDQILAFEREQHAASRAEILMLQEHISKVEAQLAAFQHSSHVGVTLSDVDPQSLSSARLFAVPKILNVRPGDADGTGEPVRKVDEVDEIYGVHMTTDEHVAEEFLGTADPHAVHDALLGLRISFERNMSRAEDGVERRLREINAKTAETGNVQGRLVELQRVEASLRHLLLSQEDKIDAEEKRSAELTKKLNALLTQADQVRSWTRNHIVDGELVATKEEAFQLLGENAEQGSVEERTLVVGQEEDDEESESEGESDCDDGAGPAGSAFDVQAEVARLSAVLAARQQRKATALHQLRVLESQRRPVLGARRAGSTSIRRARVARTDQQRHFLDRRDAMQQVAELETRVHELETGNAKLRDKLREVASKKGGLGRTKLASSSVFARKITPSRARFVKPSPPAAPVPRSVSGSLRHARVSGKTPTARRSSSWRRTPKRQS